MGYSLLQCNEQGVGGGLGNNDGMSKKLQLITLGLEVFICQLCANQSHRSSNSKISTHLPNVCVWVCVSDRLNYPSYVSNEVLSYTDTPTVCTFAYLITPNVGVYIQPRPRRVFWLYACLLMNPEPVNH